MMSSDNFKQRLQEHFTDGLMCIVGSGLSAAEGIPGMRPLAGHLLDRVPATACPNSQDRWAQIATDLNSGTDLETALHNCEPDPALQATIVDLTARFILEAEAQVIQQVIARQRTLRFSRLLTHMLKPNTGIPVVTTNYDRLIEVAAEATALGVDTLFVGQHLGRLDPKGSAYSLCRHVTQRKRVVHRSYADHIVLLKPHGSLDWFLQGNQPIRCPLAVGSQRLIITPGLNKYRTGYDQPFDKHRERANTEIDKAARYLIIGYGFNDDHLHTHLENQLRAGKPALILSRSLSAKAQQLLHECPAVTAICAPKDQEGATVLTHDAEEFLPGPNLWDLNHFIQEVLEP